MRLGLCLAGIEAGAFQDDVDIQLAPGQVSCVGHLVDDNLLAVDDDVVVLAFAFMVVDRMAVGDPVALGGVIL